MDGAAGENDLAAAEFLLPAVDDGLHADALRAFEQQFPDLRVGGDREIGALARFAIEIAHRGRDALLGLIGMRHREIAVDELAVLVRQELMAGLLEGFGESLRMLRPVLPRDSADRDTAILAMVRSVEIEVALDLLEVGQHVLPAPAGGAPRFPFIVVGRCAAVGHLAVDRGAAAQHARLLVFAQGRAPLVGIVMADDLRRDLEFGPVEARIEIGGARIAVPDLGRLVAGRGVLAGFAQQDLVGAFGRQPVRQHRTCRAAAYDDHVIHFGIPSGFFVLLLISLLPGS